MNINDLPELDSIKDKDYVLISDVDSNKVSKIKKEVFSKNSNTSSNNFNIHYKDNIDFSMIGTKITEEMINEIRKGDRNNRFKIGNWWELKGITWTIVDKNYFNLKGNKPHLVLMPNVNFTYDEKRKRYFYISKEWTNSNSAYIGSFRDRMIKRMEIKAEIAKLFIPPEYILKRKEIMGYTNGSYIEVDDCEIEMPSMKMLFGYSPFIWDSCYSQFHLFKRFPEHIKLYASAKPMHLRDSVPNDTDYNIYILDENMCIKKVNHNTRAWFIPYIVIG